MMTRVPGIRHVKTAAARTYKRVEGQVFTNGDGTISLFFQGEKRTIEYELTPSQWEKLRNHPS